MTTRLLQLVDQGAGLSRPAPTHSAALHPGALWTTRSSQQGVLRTPPQTCVPGWPKPATIPVALPHTLRAASRLLAFAQDTGRLVATGRLCRRAASSCCPSSSRRRPWPSPRSPPPRALSLGGADPSEPRLRCRCRVVRCAVHGRSDIFANLCTVRVRRPAARRHGPLRPPPVVSAGCSSCALRRFKYNREY